MFHDCAHDKFQLIELLQHAFCVAHGVALNHTGCFFDGKVSQRNHIHCLGKVVNDLIFFRHLVTVSGAYSVPYRACVPEKLDGLLLSGRNISGTHKAHSCYRVMGSCLNIGVGVGTAAAVALRDDTELRDVDIRKVQQILLDNGTKT